MGKDREVAGWITAFGNHIPIYTDDPKLSEYQKIWEAEDKAKQKQIEENKVQAETKKLQENGYKGTYHLYRAGDTSGGPTGMVYFATDEEDANRYAKPSSFKMQGKTYKRGQRSVNEYDVEVQNPVVVSTGRDAQSQAFAAYRVLHSERAKQLDEAQKGTDRSMRQLMLSQWAKEDGYKVTGQNSVQLYLDSANAKALKNSKYDAIVYTDSTKDGRVVEVITLPNHKSLKGKKGN